MQALYAWLGKGEPELGRSIVIRALLRAGVVGLAFAGLGFVPRLADPLRCFLLAALVCLPAALVDLLGDRRPRGRWGHAGVAALTIPVALVCAPLVAIQLNYAHASLMEGAALDFGAALDGPLRPLNVTFWALAFAPAYALTVFLRLRGWGVIWQIVTLGLLTSGVLIPWAFWAESSQGGGNFSFSLELFFLIAAVIILVLSFPFPLLLGFADIVAVALGAKRARARGAFPDPESAAKMPAPGGPADARDSSAAPSPAPRPESPPGGDAPEGPGDASA